MATDNTIEKRAIDTMIDQGVYFELPRRGISRMIYRKPRKVLINQPYLGTLDYLTREYLAIDFDEAKLQENPLYESRVIASKSCKQMARIVAIAVLNSRWKIKLFTRPLANYLMWRLTPKTLLNLCILITTMNNVQDFTNSIRLISGARTTTPRADLVEQKPAG
jgi:hypothetical protein